MDGFLDDISKMALALTSAQMAKDEAVKEHGVGEDLYIHFLGWGGDSLLTICQMNQELSKKPHDERVLASYNLCSTLRSIWWIDAITMVSEAYCSLDAGKTNGIELAEAFSKPDMPVLECIAINHASINEHNTIGPVSMVAAPYRVVPGRKVEWLDALVYPERATEFLKQARYPAMLRKSLQEQPTTEISEESINEARNDVVEMGFLMQEFL